MNFLDATTSKSNKAWINDEKLNITFETDDNNNIISVTATKKLEGKSKTFKRVGSKSHALVVMFQEMEQFVGKVVVDEIKRKRR